MRRAGAVAVMGDLLEPGQWQDEAAADWVFHLPPHPVRGPRDHAAARRRPSPATASSMDAHLLDAVAAGATRRIVYVADTSCYGATGCASITEDEPPRPSAWGRCLAPALDRLDGYVVAGLPIVTALAGMGLRQRVVVSRARHRAGDGGPPRAAVRQDRAVGVADSRPRLRPRAGPPRRARRSRRPLLPGRTAIRSGCTSSRRRSPVSRIVHCACGACPRRRPGSWSGRSWPTNFRPTPCSRTSGCAASASVSSIRRSSRGLSRSSERSMNNLRAH